MRVIVDPGMTTKARSGYGDPKVDCKTAYPADVRVLRTAQVIGTYLKHHPKFGASWEGYAVEEVLKALCPDEAYFWATHNGAELDLLLFKRGRRIGVECKRADAPTLTLSTRIALADLKLDKLYVVYPSEKRYPIANNVEAVP